MKVNDVQDLENEVNRMEKIYSPTSRIKGKYQFYTLEEKYKYLKRKEYKAKALNRSKKVTKTSIVDYLVSYKPDMDNDILNLSPTNLIEFSNVLYGYIQSVEEAKELVANDTVEKDIQSLKEQMLELQIKLKEQEELKAELIKKAV